MEQQQRPTRDDQSLWGVITECCEKLGVAVALAADSSGTVAKVFSADKDVAALWARHKQLESEIVTAGDAPAPSGASSSMFRESTVALCDAVFRRGLGRQAAEASLSATSKAFVETVSELASLTKEDLGTPLSADAERRKESESCSRNLCRAEQTLRERQEGLRQVRTERMKEQEQHAMAVQKLRDEVAEVEQLSEVECRQAQNDARNREAAATKAFKEREAAIREETEKLEAALEEKSRDHKKKEHEFRKRKQRTEQEVQNWVRKYDAEMGELEGNFTSVETEYTKEHDELDIAESEAATLASEREDLQAEEKRRQQKIARAVERKRLLEDAARKIQRWWRRILMARKKARAARAKGSDKPKSRSRSRGKTSSSQLAPPASRQDTGASPRSLPSLGVNPNSGKPSSASSDRSRLATATPSKSGSPLLPPLSAAPSAVGSSRPTSSKSQAQPPIQ